MSFLSAEVHTLPIVKKAQSLVTTDGIKDVQRMIETYGENNVDKVHEYLRGGVLGNTSQEMIFQYAVIGEAFTYLAMTDRLNDHCLKDMCKKLMVQGEW